MKDFTTGSKRVPSATGETKKPLSRNTGYDKDFARDAKRIATERGLTRAQRASQLGALKTSFKLREAGIEGKEAENILGLAKASTERGLTASQRAGLGSASDTLLSSVVGEAEKPVSSFEDLLDEALKL